MSLIHNYLNDKVSWIDGNGERHDNIMARIQKNIIYMDAIELKIKEGDKIARVLQNGEEELFIILSINYIPGFSEIDHMKIEVQKIGAIPNRNETHIEYNQYGTTGQVNIFSPNSFTEKIVITENDLMQLKKAINEYVNKEDAKTDLLLKLEKVKKTQGEKGFKKHFDEFIESAAKCTTLVSVISQILPKLGRG